MAIKAFSQLSKLETWELYNYISEFGFNYFYRSHDEMVKNYMSIVFDNGESHFSLWEDEKIKGTMAVITKDAEDKGEIFITAVIVKEEDKNSIGPLLDRTLAYCRNLENKTVKIGISSLMNYITPYVKAYGFSEVYRILQLCRKSKEVKILYNENITFESLSNDNKEQFKYVHNRSFVNSPNGGILTREELEEIVDSSSKRIGSAGICFYLGKPAGIYEIRIRDYTAWIEGIAVDPEFQGKGLGKYVLFKALEKVCGFNVDEVRLYVVSSNTRALDMYLNNDFKEECITSTWFAKRQ